MKLQYGWCTIYIIMILIIELLYVTKLHLLANMCMLKYVLCYSTYQTLSNVSKPSYKILCATF